MPLANHLFKKSIHHYCLTPSIWGQLQDKNQEEKISFFFHELKLCFMMVRPWEVFYEMFDLLVHKQASLSHCRFELFLEHPISYLSISR